MSRKKTVLCAILIALCLGLNACVVDSGNYTALKVAVNSNNLESVKEAAALASQSDIDRVYKYALSRDSCCNRMRIFEYLIEIGASVNNIDSDGNSMLMATRTPEEAEWYLQHGAVLNLRNRKGDNAVDYLARYGGVDEDALLQYLLEQGGEVTPRTLKAALEKKWHYGKIHSIVNQLLDQGDPTGLPPIVEAAIIGDSERFLSLIGSAELAEDDLNWVSENVIAFGSAEALDICVQHGFKLNQPDRDMYATDIAAQNGNLETLQWVLSVSQGRAPRDPLDMAILYDQREIADYLLAVGYTLEAYNHPTGLLAIMAGRGRADWLAFLLENGHGQGEDVLLVAASEAAIHGQAKALAYLFAFFEENPDATKALQQGVHDNLFLIYNVEILKLAEQYGVDLIDDDLLIHTAEEGSPEALQFLIDTGNDVNAYNEHIGSPLRSAIHYGLIDNVAILAENGADVNAIDPAQGSLLSYAARTSVNITQCLIDYGADVNIQDETGRTPLMAAVSARRVDCAKALLDAGADISIEDNVGKTAQLMAGRNKEMLELFP